MIFEYALKELKNNKKFVLGFSINLALGLWALMLLESFNVSFHDAIDVSEIAKKYGGGGHRKAAGFQLPGDFKVDDIFDKETNGRRKKKASTGKN